MKEKTIIVYDYDELDEAVRGKLYYAAVKEERDKLTKKFDKEIKQRIKELYDIDAVVVYLSGRYASEGLHIIADKLITDKTKYLLHEKAKLPLSRALFSYFYEDEHYNYYTRRHGFFTEYALASDVQRIHSNEEAYLRIVGKGFDSISRLEVDSAISETDAIVEAFYLDLCKWVEEQDKELCKVDEEKILNELKSRDYFVDGTIIA